MITSKELRQKYLKFFESKGHTIIPSASLVPENDPSVLFTTAGMHPLVPFLMGEKHPGGKRLADVQKCVRTGDIDTVGDQWHLTFFEMLGNWSLGDYFKKEALEWSLEFLCSPDWLGISKEKIAVSVFAGDKDSPFDEEAYNIWRELGIPEDRIYRYGKKENWWGPAAATGPCGPDSEMFYITDKEPCGPDCEPKCDCGKYVEVWNDVFMQYNKTGDGKFEPLKQKNIDTGMGLERIVAVLNSYDDVYQGTMKGIIEKIEELSNMKYLWEDEHKKMDSCWAGVMRSMRIIADHLRTASFIMGDDLGIAPSNVDQGYVVRKLIRRAIRHGRRLGIKENFTLDIGRKVIEIYGDFYKELERNKEKVLTGLGNEEDKFTRTLQQGLKIISGKVEKLKSGKVDILDGKDAFDLFQTYGFPFELTKELAEEEGIKVDEKGFNREMERHQELSRTAAAGKFKGGLGEESGITIKYHTATHLLHAALREVLGKHVEQRGSNITGERLRFDFSHPEKMTEEEKEKVEKIVNDKIKADLPIKQDEMTVEEAGKKGAIGLFASKYGERVKVYSVGDYSKEICGGPHVERTGDLGKFRIKKEEASSAGVRRIKAVLE